METVTAVLPVYNVKKYLVRCLESVIKQTIAFDHIILVNDGSTDGCEEICEKYTQEYEYITLVNKQNGGLVSAWKEGLKFLNTTHVCFIDSDDYVAEDYLETLKKGLTADVDMVCMNAIQSFDTGETRKLRINGLDAGTYIVEDSFKGSILSDHGAFVRPIASCRWAKIIRADLVKEYAQYCSEKISYGEDQQLTLGVLLGCRKVCVLDAYKYYYQYNTTSILHTYKKNLWEKVDLLMKTIDGIPGIREIPNYQRQFNTQFLLYFSECLRNESYNHSLTRDTYSKMLVSDGVQTALRDYYEEKMRKIDRVVVSSAKKKQFLITKTALSMYKLLYRIKGIPG